MSGPTAGSPAAGRPPNLFAFCLTLISTLLILLGSVYSLVCLYRTRNKTPLVMIVASLSADDLLYVVALTVFAAVQWTSESVANSVCPAAAVLYFLHGVSIALKSSLIVIYNYFTTRLTGLCKGGRAHVPIPWILATIWTFSLLTCLLPVFGWGSYIPTPWGCLPDHRSSYVAFLFGLYSMCFVVLIGFSVPLVYKLLCSDWQHQGPFSPNYHEVATASKVSFSEDAADRTLTTGGNWGNGVHSRSEASHSPPCLSESFGSTNQAVIVAQKRFALILAMSKIVLWLPLMIRLLVNHITEHEDESFEILGYFLTLLAAAITPLFVLSERWIHLPCGCFINCSKNVYSVAAKPAKGKRKDFEFNLSLQQSYGIYKISQECNRTGQESKSLSHHNLVEHPSGCCKFLPGRNQEMVCEAPAEISTTLDSSPRANPHKDNTSQDKNTGQSLSGSPDGVEDKLTQEEGHKPEVVDWEWYRSKSERTPRQKPSALSIPVCAFQGMVSLHAPSTGKTLSLSTYEISGDGRKIAPLAKRVEVYRSKSVGHEPSSEDSPGSLADTNVKIHLEVLEICDNEEVLDTVSIVSNISQSSAQARSPSLRYSRRENRFVSVDLTESASYSLLIPTDRSGSDISISIPDTVEAHRRNSHKQHQDRSGYQEEIQLLNEAYRRQEEASKNC
ncbi:probable G-protein coupled receptor 149 [Amblyraja radiata]|uniref:probable G-protein coupled receptor 149 n=1 Tax=Amblyraja radiata TaxID=386614 RepID=UPI0014035D95|nr:probable G-protein coupled receptor 149 [Amblyraja radiata]